MSALLLSSCELLSPDEVLNPNVEAQDFATSPQAMRNWVNGTEANFGVAVAAFAENTGILSDDLFNNSSRSSKTYDQLDIHYTDVEVYKLSIHIGKLLQMTAFGLDEIAKNDAETTEEQLFKLYYIRAYAYLLAGENFVALPREAHGEVLESEALLQTATEVLDEAMLHAQQPADRALVALLKARALRGVGQMKVAAAAARESLIYAEEMVTTVQFDALNGYVNSLHEYVAGNLFTILERMQFEAAKFPMLDYWNQPLAIAKSEEAYLILAEAAVYEQKNTEAADLLQSVLRLVSTRTAAVSLTSVTAQQIADAADTRTLLETIYLLRQELFFGEGRRSSDLGIRLPISEVEYNEQGNLPERYTQAVIPAYLQPIRTEIDKHQDLNRRLVESMAL